MKKKSMFKSLLCCFSSTDDTECIEIMQPFIEIRIKTNSLIFHVAEVRYWSHSLQMC